MLKVVLVEDESRIREAIRDTVPWEEYGYKFVGEAGDGEMALSVLRKTSPDVLITDIKMPFMDGLELCRIAMQEFPKLKIIIISGYDDFEYARQAIEIGAWQYLLKPITKQTIKKVLIDLKAKIDQENEQSDYQAKFNSEVHEYEQFGRRRFFEKMLEGELSVGEIYDEAGKQGINISAPCYSLLFILIREKDKGLDDKLLDEVTFCQDEVIHYFLRNPKYVLFSWNVNCYGVLVMTEADQMEAVVNRCVEKVTEICSRRESILEWYVAVSDSVERLSRLPECYQNTNKYLAYRFMQPSLHVLNEKNLKQYITPVKDSDISSVDPSKMDPEIIKDFLIHGSLQEVVNFSESYISSVSEALNSTMFRDYLVLNIRFTLLGYLGTHGVSEAELKEKLTGNYDDIHLEAGKVRGYLEDMLTAALLLRDKESDYLTGKILRSAIQYIDSNYSNENISLNEVAAKVDVSSNYLSALFSQKMEKTFVEYITGKRMEMAKKLLHTTDMSTGEIAAEIGYKDPHYFSFVFKKTQGKSPREYRALNKN